MDELRKFFAVWVCVLIFMGSSVMLTNVDADRDNTGTRSAGSDLTISDTHTVSGLETWSNVTVTGTGKLIVPVGTTFNVTNIYLQNGSIVEISGGNVTLTSKNHAANVNFNGTCSYFNVTGGGSIYMKGSNGYANTSLAGPYIAYIPVSKGGDVELNVTASDGLRIENSTVTVIGGDGFDLPTSTYSACNAWSDGGNLGGHVAAGGVANMVFDLTNTNAIMTLYNTTIYLEGGGGGAASDGGLPSGNTNGKGGGYSSGGGCLRLCWCGW